MSALTTYQPTNFGELESFCQRVTKSGLAPPAYKNKPEDAMIAIMMGDELGLKPLTSLQFIAVINGRPGVYSDAMPGLAFSKGMIIDMQEKVDGEGDNMVATCVVTRANGTKVTQTFSVAEAKNAGLWKKSGPWSAYPRRMLQWRARSWAIRDAAPQLYFGMSAEELHDIPTDDQPVRGPDHARDITPPDTTTPAASPQAAVAAANAAAEAARKANEMKQLVKVVDQHGETIATTSHWPEALKRYRELTVNSTDPQQVGINNLGMLKAVRPHVSEKVRPKLEAEIEAIETIMAAPTVDDDGVVEESTYSADASLFGDAAEPVREGEQ